MTKVVSHDDGVTTTVEFDEGENRFVVGHHQDVSGVLDHVAERNNDGTNGWSPSRNWRLLGSIPEALYTEWLLEAYKQGIPLYHKSERDKFLKRKMVDYRRLFVNGRTPNKVVVKKG